MRRIEVVIDPAGGVKIEAVEFTGPDCEKSTRFLEVALGTLKNRRRKPEYLLKVHGPSRQQVRV
ncbi:MAG: DUF2997 domain-containing protein [bacterium]